MPGERRRFQSTIEARRTKRIARDEMDEDRGLAIDPQHGD
jgi:hypothetical protein